MKNEERLGWIETQAPFPMAMCHWSTICGLGWSVWGVANDIRASLAIVNSEHIYAKHWSTHCDWPGSNQIKKRTQLEKPNWIGHDSWRQITIKMRNTHTLSSQRFTLSRKDHGKSLLRVLFTRRTYRASLSLVNTFMECVHYWKVFTAEWLASSMKIFTVERLARYFRLVKRCCLCFFVVHDETDLCYLY